MAIKADGTLWGWGDNGFGKLGDGTTMDRWSPVQIGIDNKWRSISAAESHNIALKSDGTLWAWGGNSTGQLGDGTNTTRNTPTQIGTDNNWVSVEAEQYYSIALKSDGTLWAWGLNAHGQLGDGTNTARNTPTQVGTDNNWHSISPGVYHTMALKSDGTLWAWGNNSAHELGDGTNVNKNSPIQIGSDNNWVSIAAGAYSSMALKSDGTLWAWGSNFYGEFGDGTNTHRGTPGQIGTDNNWVSIEAEGGRTIALKSDGTLWAWGLNDIGQLGVVTTETCGFTSSPCSTIPIQIGIDNNWVLISAGYKHTIAIKSDGTLWAWGRNYFGQLGDGTTTDRLSPVQVYLKNALTVTTAGTGSGALTSSPAGIDCGADCSQAYNQGTVVTLTATPNAGSTFDGWSGDADCSDGQVTMDADKTCTATFTIIPNQPPVANAGPDQIVEATSPSGASVQLNGSVSSDPDGDALSFTWTWPSGAVSGANPTVIFPLGTHTVTLTVSDGQAASSDTVQVIVQDTTPPVIQSSQNPLPNANGWNNTDVTVTFTATDAVSNIIPCEIVALSLTSNSPVSVTVNSEGASQDVIIACTDGAGNSATASHTVNIDKTAPTVAVARTPEPNPNGWNNTDVTAHFTAADNLSGIQGDSFFDVFFTLEGAGQGDSHTFTDLAGNTGSATIGNINIDKTAPVITCPVNITAEATSSAGATVNYPPATATDTLSTPTILYLQASGTVFPLGTTTVAVSATDAAGNSATCSFDVAVQDTTPPALSNMPANISHQATSGAGRVIYYTLPAASDIVDATPTVSCNPPSGSTFAIGTTTVTCTATDDAGNAATASFSVTITAPDSDADGLPDVADPCPSDATNTCNSSGSGAAPVDEGGGTVTTPDGSVSITFPPGAVSGDTTVSISNTGSGYELTNNLGNALGVYGVVLQPEGTTFDQPVTIVFTWPDADNNGLVDGTNLREDNLRITKDGVAVTDKCKNEPVRCDQAANTFTIQVTSFSAFVVAGPLDRDNDGIYDNYEGIVDRCPLEDSRGFDADNDGCIDSFAGFATNVKTLAAEGIISTEMEQSLISKVANAEKSSDKDNICAAINQLNALKAQIAAQRGKKISEPAAILLIEYADNLIRQLENRLPAGESCV